MPAGRYAIDDHLRGKPPELVALFELLLDNPRPSPGA
jgi:hypothetical protein